MKVKLLLSGEAVPIAKIGIPLGVGLVSVWIDNHGFTSATNDLGAIGFIFLETREIDIGEVDSERQQLFSNIHGQIVTFDIKPNLFVRSGGIAQIAMTIGVQQGGKIIPKKIEFVADECTGVSIVDKPLSFSVTMLQLENKLAELDGATIVSDEDVVAIARLCTRARWRGRCVTARLGLTFLEPLPLMMLTASGGRGPGSRYGEKFADCGYDSDTLRRRLLKVEVIHVVSKLGSRTNLLPERSKQHLRSVVSALAAPTIPASPTL